MAPPRGMTFPFPPKHSSIWLSSHVTYEQAVEMFFNQTATQQFMGISPLVSSKTFKGVTYAAIQDAQQAHTERMNAEYEAIEQRDLEFENKGIKAFITANDKIRNRIVPTENGLESLTAYRKPMGEKCGSSITSFAKSLVNQSNGSSESSASTPLAAPMHNVTEQGIVPAMTQPLASVVPNQSDNDVFMLGWYQVEQSESKDLMWDKLFTDETSQEKKNLIKQHNFHLNSMVRQGEIVIIPTMKAVTSKDKQAVADLQEEAKAASVELGKVSLSVAESVYRHFDVLDYYASKAWEKIDAYGMPSDYFAYASMGAGALASGVGKHLENINNILIEVNDLYISQVAMSSRTGGMGMNNGTFLAERAALFSKLDGSFSMLSKRSINIPSNTQIRKKLGLSAKSIMHNADEIINKGWVPNLGKRIANIVIGISASKGLGYIGLALGAASGVSNIYEACKVDGTGECGKTTTREVAGFIGGTLVGIEVGKIAVVLVLGVVGTASAPVIALATVGAVVVGGGVGGVVGATGSKLGVDFIYESVESALRD